MSVTRGGVISRLPFTLPPLTGVTAAWVSSAAVVPSVAVIDPPSTTSAFAAMLMPSSSRSPACTA